MDELKPWTYRVVREDLVKYAHASGDANPIHQNEDFAKQVGLPDVIAHGMHTMGKIGQYVTDWCGDPAALESFNTRFTAMVVVPKDGGAAVTVSGRIAERLDGGRARLELQAESAGQVVGQAEAIVRVG
ncbi:MAG: MaoC family dehydratase N-terminal domain-containing protein [Actinobacteria bacterium]|nr:MaoC family dehydratase N-terminal domain-containing protein [Actinomycetota bacterium]